MPLLKIQTNVTLDNPEKLQVMARLSAVTSAALGKPERYVMVILETDIPMQFAADNAGTIYAELKSIGLPENRTESLSATLCAALTETMAVPGERIYIEFANAGRHMWGWDGATF
jgi:phenylpyruvate tautomerase